MKRIYLVLILLFVASDLIAQPWVKNMPQGKTRGQLTFSNYKNAFDQYWAPFNVDKGTYLVNGVKTKAPGWKQFKRWEYYMETQINPTTGEFPTKTAQEVYKEYLKTNPSKKSAGLISVTNSSSWTSLGPTSSGGGYAGTGRLNCVAFHPSDINTYWVGAAAGGMWVTTNNGATWSCLTDNNGVLAVSDIIIPSDYATSNTIYIATGDRDHWDNNSIGVLKSTDGGATWNTTGLTYPISNGAMVYRLLLDPGNNQTLIAATSSGVYKTTNGGTTWTTQLSAVSFIDMEYKPGDFNTLYGSTTSGAIYVSSNGGTSWTKSFSDVNAYRISLAVSANQPATVYAIAANSSSGLYGIYKSTDSGATFTKVNSGTPGNLLGWAALGNDTSGQGWYDLSISASPSNANTLLVGGVNTWRSLDGGVTWAIVNHWWGDGVPAVHADKHMLLYRNDGYLFECNDGGIYSSGDNGTTWNNKTNGIVISQMYKLGVSQTTNSETITGLQDNGTKLMSGGTWSDVKGGDGMECLIDYSNGNIQYGTYVAGQIDRTTDHWSTATDITAAIPGGLGATGAWVSPYLIDPVNPQTLYVGYSDIWKTTDRGNSWAKISSMNSSNKIRSMAIAPSNPQVLFVADPYIIWKTPDNGTSWTNITGTLPTGSGRITYIAVKNDDPTTLWVTLSGYNATKVFQSINGGTTWTDISAGLPSIPAYSIIQNKQTGTEVQLYAATELGVYFKKGSDNWIAYNTGIPNVSVGELEIYYAANPIDSKLRAATFGRGLWESPVYYSSVPMTFTSATTTQNNSSTIGQNQTSQEIIGIQIVTDGNLTPLSATSFSFNTTGSTNPVTDITNAKVYYTGTSNTLATTTQFGSTSVSPNGTFTVSGTQALSTGINYFWLTYDVPITAVLNDVLDAQCTSLTVGTPNVPTVTDPSGNRTIGIVNYCTSGSTATTLEYISNVAIGTINQASGRGTGGYQDYTTQTTDLQIGTNYTAKLTVTTSYTTDQVLIWIDWNKNGVFTDPGELVYASSGTFTSPHTTAAFTPPVGTLTGPTRMRIRLHDTTSGPNATPCGTATWGEVEDYTVNITAACTPPSAPTGTTPQTFCAFNSPTIASLSATGTSLKWYSAATGGTALSTSTVLVNNTHYFASQTVSSCESTDRLDVTAAVTTIAAPTGTAAQTYCSASSPTVANLIATGTSLKWYAAATGGTALATSTALVNNTHYYASQTINSCESTTRLNVTVTLSATPTTPAIGTITQPTCALASGSVILNSLPATAWTLTQNPDATTTQGTGTSFTKSGLASGIYTYTVTNSAGCISASSANVTINAQPLAPAAPTGTAAQSFCAGISPTVATLVASGTALKWYTTLTGGTSLATTTALVDATHYYASQTVSGCESSARLDVTVTVTAAPAAPTGSAAQTFCSGATTGTVANLVAAGSSIKWYSVATGGTALATTTALVNGSHYYASQTVNTCESASRLNVTATVNATPSVPTVGTITQPTCALATGSVILNGLPSTGTWTLTRTPGTITTTGTGTTKTITGLASATYTYTVTSSTNCISVSSANIVINAQPAAPAAPTGTAAQSFCTGATVASLVATGTSLKWYTAATGGTALATTTTLVNGTHYYASQTVSTCESATRFNVTATVNALPAAPAAIGGTKSVCVGKTTTLTDTTTGGVWSSSNTSVATIGTTGIVTGVAAGTATITYTVKNASGCTRSVTTTVTVNPIAAQPGAFTASTASVTLGQSRVRYTVPLVSGITYKWSYSGTGATITGTTNSVLVSYSLTATSGTLGVTATNSCGTSIARTIAISGLKAAIIPAATIQGSAEAPADVQVITPRLNELKVYPNPTSGQVTFEFQITQDAKAKLDIYTMNGQHISRIFDADLKAGVIQTVLFDQSLPSGIYPCILTWKGEMITVKLIIVQ